MAKFCALVSRDQTDAETEMLRLTMQPVYVVHDEYMFLRILQSFETNFAWMAVRLRGAIDAFDDNPDQVAPQIRNADRMYREAAMLFPVLATMQPEAFQVFREYTDGASAIQSRNYKTVESLCRPPGEKRRDSLAYESVPEVREKILVGQPSLDAAFRRAQSCGRFSPERLGEIETAMSCFAATLQRWRQTHYRLAVKVLGDQRGTGNTEGTPYLSAVREVPVFLSVSMGK